MCRASRAGGLEAPVSSTHTCRGVYTKETGEHNDLYPQFRQIQSANATVTRFCCADCTTHRGSSLTWGLRPINCGGWTMAMRKRQGKTTAKISHVSNSEALNSSIGKLQIKLENGHGFNEHKQKDRFVKTAFEMKKLKKKKQTKNNHHHSTTSHKCESVHICP